MGGLRHRRWLVTAATLAGWALSAVPAAASSPLGAGALTRDLRTYARLGVDGHLTGSVQEEQTLAWILDQLRVVGKLTGVDGVSFYAFHPTAWSLSAGGHSVRSLAPYFYSGQTGQRGITAPLVDAGEGTPGDLAHVDVKGKIAVIRVPYLEDFLDPTFTGQGQARGAFASVGSAGAVGLVAVTDGPQDYPVNQDVSSTLGLEALPTLFVGKHAGATVIRAADAGQRGTLLLAAQPARACTQNLWAVLPGRDSSRFIVIGTPSSGFDEAASERGAGLAILLGLARRYAALPVSQRPVTLVFAVFSGHEVGVGIPTFAEQHPEWFGQRTDAYVGLGASIAARQLYELANGAVTSWPFGDLSRDLYVSENPLLEPIVQRDFVPAQPLGSIPPGGFDPGEQQLPYLEGIPIVAISGASYYFHTAGDTPSGVSAPLLAASASAFASSIDDLMSLPAGALRQANAAAGTLGAEKAAKGSGDPRFQAQPDASCAQIGAS